METDERRKLERFELAAPARILVQSGRDKRVEYDLMIRDLSSAGAFLHSSRFVPVGTAVRMDFVLALDALQKLTAERGRARVRVRGKVIRSDSQGIAVRFESNYKITALSSESSHGGAR
jgi:PilZ domain